MGSKSGERHIFPVITVPSEAVKFQGAVLPNSILSRIGFFASASRREVFFHIVEVGNSRSAIRLTNIGGNSRILFRQCEIADNICFEVQLFEITVLGRMTVDFLVVAVLSGEVNTAGVAGALEGGDGRSAIFGYRSDFACSQVHDKGLRTSIAFFAL